MTERKYYEAYDERYKTVHRSGYSWSGFERSPIVPETIEKYGLTTENTMLEIGCGEGRDANVLLQHGYDLLATDISPEAISYCQARLPEYADSFAVLDCINGVHSMRYDFIYAIAVVHMLVENRDRKAFYDFIYHHLNDNGIALVCTMGDGESEMQSDTSKAFELQLRDHPSGEMLVAATSCRMVSFAAFETELKENGFAIIDKGFTEAMPSFNCLMYAVIKRKNFQE